jgi:transcriptional regulator with XRE-family HTH domain/tetratricopeptide (TPR) repeat protein
VAESFGAMLRRHRQAASLTQEALAEQAAVSSTAIAALERGRRRAPRLTTLRQIARALGLSPEELAELARAAEAERDATGAVASGPLAGLLAAPAPDSRDAPPVSDGDSALPLPGIVARRWRTGFVGRGNELAELERAWAERQRLVLVGGEAGIGKTRLVSEFAARRALDGTTVAWGRCTEEGLGAYLPFVEVARHLVAAADGPRLARAVGRRGELTRLVPELEARVGSLPSPTSADAGTEQRLLFESMAALLTGFAPLLVVLDDLHWADEATIALLRYLVRDPALGEVVIVALVREVDLDPKTAGLLAELGRDVETKRLRLPTFDEEALTELVVDLVGSSVAGEVVQSVATATEGNAFFAEEMTVHLIDSGLIVDSAGEATLRGDAVSAGLPHRVRETLTRRLLSLPGDALDLLTTGSVIGREFDLSVAAAATGLDSSRLVDAADDGLLSGLVQETRPGRLCFSHALVQHAVGDRLSFARAAAVHRRVAVVLEERSSGAGTQAPAADLARHWTAVAAVDPSAATMAATWAVRAGDAALAAAAADEAIARYEQASALWSTASQGHADALVRLGMALQYRGRAEEADGRFRDALALASVLGDATLQARAAIGLGRRYPYWETDSDRIEALEQALVALGEKDELLRLTLMGLLVTQMINGFRQPEAERRDELADHLAAVADDPSTSDETLSCLGQTRVYDTIEDPVRLDRVAGRLARVGAARNDLRVLAVARFSQALSALDRGSMEDLETAAARYGEVADQLDDPLERSQAATLRSTIAFIEGRYADGEELTAAALALGKESGDHNADLVFYAQGLLRAVDLGQAAEVLPLLVAATDYQQIASFTAGTALCAALAGENDLAHEYLEAMMRSGFSGSPRGADRLAPTAFLAHTCGLLGVADHAETLAEALSSQPAVAVRVGPLIGWWGPVDHHLGSLCRLLGRLEEAEVHLRRAMALEERSGARPFLARTRGELARVIAPGSTEAEALRSAAVADAQALRATGVAAEVNAP